MAKREGIRRLLIAGLWIVWLFVYLIGFKGMGYFTWSAFFGWTVFMVGIAVAVYGITKAVQWVRKGFDQPT
jgi:hypothetical protein